MVALGAPNESHLLSRVLGGLLLRRIPCYRDETQPEGSITLTRGHTLVGIKWTLSDPSPVADDARISYLVDTLAFTLAVTHRVERYTVADIAHRAEATLTLNEMKGDLDSFGTSPAALEDLIGGFVRLFKLASLNRLWRVPLAPLSPSRCGPGPCR